MLKDIEKYTIEDMKVFKVDDYYIASPTLVLALSFVHDHIREVNVRTLKMVEEVDIDEVGMWKQGDTYLSFLQYGTPVSWVSLREYMQQEEGVGVYLVSPTETWA